MQPSSPLFQRVAFASVAIAIVGIAGFFFRGSPNAQTGEGAPPSVSTAPDPATQDGQGAGSAGAVVGPPLRLAAARAEFGVLVNHVDIKVAADRKKLSAQFTPALCGSASLCDAAKAVVDDAGAMSFEQKPRKHWLLPTRAQLAMQRPALTTEEIDREEALSDLVIISATGTSESDHRVARAAFATALLIARTTKGFVVDMSSNRIESAAVFAGRVVNRPDGQLGAPQLDFQTSPTVQHGYVRMTTTGLERFGLPDLEASEVTPACAAQMPNIFVAVARQLAREGANTTIHLTTASLELGATKPAEEGEVAFSLVGSTPSVGDRMTALVRIEPHGGANADAYLDMVEALVGQLADDHLSEKELAEIQLEAQRRLPAALMVQRATPGAVLHVLMAFEPAKGDEDGEAEWLWVEVNSWNEREVIGTVVDEPMEDDGVQRGSRIRRMRGDVVDYQLTLPNGTIEHPGENRAR